jgi:hypothetical protein
MFDFLSQGKKPVLKIFSFILLVTLVTNLININFEVENYRLDKSIDKLEEEKSILRARYLSDTSMSRLDYKATALKMNEISNENCTKLSKAVQETKFKVLKKEYLESKDSLVSSNAVYLSGF